MSTVETLKEYVDVTWAEVQRTHSELTTARTEAAADAFQVALLQWREAVGQYDREVMTRVQLVARLNAGVSP